AAGPVAAVVTLVLVVLATVIYYAIPVPGRMREASWALLFSLGVVVLALLILFAIIRLLGRGEGARMRALVVLLTVTVLFFSWADASVAKLPGQFAELHTKTDALYFNVSTLATVGFGDVHPVGQLARSAVIIEIIFNLVFLGAAVTVISGMARAGARRRIHPPEHDTRPQA
ncbi:MAG TPA: potassium channel family protein, partial [Streptosporangiaceae bacterium]